MYVCACGCGRARGSERQKLHQPGQCHPLFKASNLLFFTHAITVPSDLYFSQPNPLPSSWKIWKRKIKLLAACADGAQPACLCHHSRGRSAATAPASRLQRDEMQLLLIGSQVGKLCFLLTFPLPFSFFFLLFLSFFFFLFSWLFFHVPHPPPLLRRT